MLQTDATPLLNEGAIWRKLHDAAGVSARTPFVNRLLGDHALAVVAVGDIDAAVRAYDHVVRLIKMRAITASLTRHPKAHEKFARRAELMYLMPFGALFVTREVGHPYVAL